MPATSPYTRRRTDALPPSAAFDAWRAATGEEPPDFDRLRPRPDVWCPSAGLASPAGWPGRRAAIRTRWRRWLLGGMPPAPSALYAEEVGHGTERLLRLRPAGPTGPVLHVRLLLPAKAEGPVPVLLTQTRHERWGRAAQARGWAAALVSACEGDDDMDAVAAVVEGADWSALARRAWALSRALDALRDVREVDPARVLVGGHAEDGKAALVAAAHDERFAAVVSSSSGALGAIPARLCAERHAGEGVEGLTRRHPDWFHPRLRFFAGREDRLPTDAHELLACIAPRPLLLSVALRDEAESTAAAERTVAAVRSTWELLGAPGAVTLRWRDGGHAADDATLQAHLDWGEHVLLGRGAAPSAPALLHGGGWRPWPASRIAPPPGWRPRGTAWTRRSIARGLGVRGGEPSRPRPGRPPRPAHADPPVHVLPAPAADGVVRVATSTADGVAVDVHLPGPGRAGAAARPAGPAPLVLWLPALSRAGGYRGGHAGDEPLHLDLARDGFAVACHDPLGAGSRLAEGARFAARHPRWSPLGRMVADAQAVVEAAGALPGVDGRRVLLAGYGTGALVAAHVLALCPAVTAAALVAPSGDEPLLPCGFTAPPAGLVDLLATAAGRRVLVLSPRVGFDLPAVEAAARAAGVAHEALDDHHRLAPAARRRVRGWLRDAAADRARRAA